ncbi:MAG: methylenetetrahydrofolate--tRNA-(uracil(54)-C(5))-methyltransferase (FADH(2)-oxidizing) TrmFO [Candidatus Palauibacterales bacterium]|nr:methylenetetrahydrofolate--tRNA-(uracil(54)-C(5))-methyltransferase (FADH(2)-oxidizing) TrmFO [Candidatus Palauibacterales bacterium]MDP2482890.1 methylenetetrahydrofolate--tRNA-(uracil(54)-C(5))-methyltransferase (FADH(2)-oxidizing) TrmFO [Candidatus Palauibacterales bacterium]
MADRSVTIVGGGLAGSEAAWQLARLGHRVDLYEMRPGRPTPAHQTDRLAEIVCTNSFKSVNLDTPHGLLKAEMRLLGCRLLGVADEFRVPAGSALAVDRHRFSAAVTERLEAEPGIRVIREEISELPRPPAIVATGPLTSDALSTSIAERLGADGLSFFDAIAPIFSRESIDEEVAWLGSRYGKGEAAYLNCPLDQQTYESFVDALLGADVYVGHEWENVPYFEGCLPIEVMARRGRETLRFGPMRPVGLEDPATGRRAHAVVQLRAEDLRGQMWNLVGFQTRLRRGEQERVFRMIPGLERAEFLRYGSIHRNAYLCFPSTLEPHGGLPDEPDLLFAGQLTGVEGYTESIASGLLAALNIDRMLQGLEPVVPPPTTMLGGLYRYLREADPGQFQPMNANFGLLDPLPGRVRGGKRNRRTAHSERALEEIERWAAEHLPAAARGQVSP